MHYQNDEQKIILELDLPLREALQAQKNYLKKLQEVNELLERDDSLDEESIITSKNSFMIRYLVYNARTLYLSLFFNHELYVSTALVEHYFIVLSFVYIY